MTRPLCQFIDLASGQDETRSVALVPLDSDSAAPAETRAPFRITQFIRHVRSLLKETRPQALLLRTGPHHRRAAFICWLLKRIFARDILFGIVAESSGISAGSLGIPLRLCDFVIVATEEERAKLIRTGYFARRVLVTPEAPQHPSVIGFLTARLTAEQKSILWSDAHLQYQNPSTKHLLYALPYLQKEGYEVRAFTLLTDLTPDNVEVTLLPGHRLFRNGLLQLLSYFFIANTYQLYWRLLHGHSPARLTHAMGGMDLWADVSSFHFVNALWIPIQWRLGFHSFKEFLQAFPPFFGLFFDFCQFHNRRCKVYLPVSNSIAEDIRHRVHRHAKVEVLPNTYDSERFNAGVRLQWRIPTRQSLGIPDEMFVFAFISQGHYRRKGFWLAVEALHKLHQRITSRPFLFLIVGGKEAALMPLKQQLDQRYHGSEQWIHFTGFQPQVERYLAAADAFLFPSYFEAFSLAEIEAAAIGLPLLLTRHHGSEMILEEGVNGIFLSFRVQEMVRELEGFLKKPIVSSPHAGKALNVAEYAERLRQTYENLA